MKGLTVVAAALASSLIAFPALAEMAPVGSVTLRPVDTRAVVTYPVNITGDILALTARNYTIATHGYSFWEAQVPKLVAVDVAPAV